LIESKEGIAIGLVLGARLMELEYQLKDGLRDYRFITTHSTAVWIYNNNGDLLSIRNDPELKDFFLGGDNISV